MTNLKLLLLIVTIFGGIPILLWGVMTVLSKAMTAVDHTDQSHD